MIILVVKRLGYGHPYYMDILANEHVKLTEVFIIGIGVRAVDKPLNTIIKAQHGLYTLISKGTNENDINIRIIDYTFAPVEI